MMAMLTIRKVVCGERSSAATLLVRSPNPSITPLSERKNVDSSASMSTPVTRAKIEKTSAVPRPNSLAVSPPGARNTCRARPSRNPSSRDGALRKSSALRDGGVSRTITSKSCSS